MLSSITLDQFDDESCVCSKLVYMLKPLPFRSSAGECRRSVCAMTGAAINSVKDKIQISFRICFSSTSGFSTHRANHSSRPAHRVPVDYVVSSWPRKCAWLSPRLRKGDG